MHEATDKKIQILTEADMLVFGTQIAQAITVGAVIFLYGDLGAGKTTFTRGFLHGLGYHGKVKSPTYTLVEPYEINERHIYHFDLYRLHDPEELAQIGIEEYFSAEAICLIEWPEKGFPLLPAPDLACHIEFVGTGRNVRLHAHSERGREIISKI